MKRSDYRSSFFFQRCQNTGFATGFTKFMEMFAQSTKGEMCYHTGVKAHNIFEKLKQTIFAFKNNNKKTFIYKYFELS